MKTVFVFVFVCFVTPNTSSKVFMQLNARFVRNIVCEIRTLTQTIR